MMVVGNPIFYYFYPRCLGDASPPSILEDIRSLASPKYTCPSANPLKDLKKCLFFTSFFACYFERLNDTRDHYVIVSTCNSETKGKQYETIPKFFHFESTTH